MLNDILLLYQTLNSIPGYSKKKAECKNFPAFFHMVFWTKIYIWDDVNMFFFKFGKADKHKFRCSLSD